MSLLFKITYGLYAACASAEGKDNACIINTLMQQTASPERYSITINKANLTAELIAKSGKCCIAVLSKDTKFDFIKNFGMQSGRNADKYDAIAAKRAENGVLVPLNSVIGYFEMKVEDSIDMGTHMFFVLSADNIEQISDAEPLTYAYYQSDIKPRPQAVKSSSEEIWVCKVCGYVHKGPLPADFICPLCKHTASDFERQVLTEKSEDIKNNIKGDKTMAKFICSVCGYVHEGDKAPEMCPQCKAPASKFSVQEEGAMSWAAEHVVGVAAGVPQDIYEGLKMNFEGECTEVGMYLAMARVAHREGYPEIGLYWEKAAYEEAEHAAKFAELLGEVISDSTKVNLEKRVMAENGATQGKFDLAKRAKEEGLDAIHDTVHEMARDEARHGKAFAGLLKRYFN